MHVTAVVVGMVLVFAGTGGVLAAAWRSRERPGALAYLLDVESPAEPAGPPDEADPPMIERLLRPLARRASARIRTLYPPSNLDRLHRRLLHAGLSTAVRAEEFATVQVIALGVAGLLGAAICLAGGGSVRLRVLALAVLVFMALLAPPSWLARRIRLRTAGIERDLPDVLDLLTIAVESGLGLEQAMETACSDIESPMTDELARTLQEMSLGLSRQQALDNLKERSESPDLTSFVLVLSQADVLGMPIGRVLRTQADEMRNRRQARAREQAAKLPVKILFPLIFFILPPLMIIVLGPAVTAIYKAFG